MYLRTEHAMFFMFAIIAANVFSIFYLVHPQVVYQNQSAISAVTELQKNYEVCVESFGKCTKDGNYEKVLRLEQRNETLWSTLEIGSIIAALIIFVLLVYYFVSIKDKLKDAKELEIKYNELKQNLEAVQGKKK